MTPNLYDHQKKFYRQSASGFTGFEEMIVSAATPIIDLKSTYGLSNLRDVTAVTGSGSVSNDNGEFAVSTGTTSGSTASLSSAERGRYIAGFEATPGLGVRLNTRPSGDQIARWGYYDDNDGFGFGEDSTGTFVFLRTGGTETKYYSDDWSVNKDPFDCTEFTIYRMPFRWYGAGPVIFEVSTIDNQGFPLLKTLHCESGASDVVFTENPNLLLRVEVDNGTSTDDLIAYVGGRQFFVQGNYNPNYRLTTESNTGVSVSDGVFTPVITFRQKTTLETVASKLSQVALSTSGSDVIWQVRVGGTVSTASFGSVGNIPDSETSYEVDTASTSISNGQKIAEGIAVAGQGNTSGGTQSDLPEIDLPKGQEVTLCAAGIGGTATVNAVFGIREEW